MPHDQQVCPSLGLAHKKACFRSGQMYSRILRVGFEGVCASGGGERKTKTKNRASNSACGPPFTDFPFPPPSSTMVSGNLPVLGVLLVPLVLWGSESPQAAALGTADNGAGKHDPRQVPLQSILLRRLGLQRRPEPKAELVAPQHLLDLYRFYLGEGPAPFRDAELPFLEERGGGADTVRVFHHTGEAVAVHVPCL